MKNKHVIVNKRELTRKKKSKREQKRIEANIRLGFLIIMRMNNLTNP